MTVPAARQGRYGWWFGRLALTPMLLAGPIGAAAQLPAPASSAPVALHVGGYGSLVINTTPLGDSARMSESSVALLVSGTLSPRLAYFAELDAVRSTNENYAGRQDDRALEVARLYGEYTITDAARIRIGRFLTPVGQWNESNAEPVTWAAVRPLSTYRPFAKEATGILLAGSRELLGHDAGYALYAATSAGRRDTNEVRFARALGGRIAVELAPGLWLGGSAAAVAEVRPFATEDDEGETGDGGAPQGVRSSLRALRAAAAESDGEVRDQGARGLFGADLRWRGSGVDLLAEAVSLSSGSGGAGQRGAFAQGAIPSGLRDIYLVAGTELYYPPNGTSLRTGSLGLTYRAPGRLTLKLERQVTASPSQRVARGWFAAVSLLF